jgi:hypothetical protein
VVIQEVTPIEDSETMCEIKRGDEEGADKGRDIEIKKRKKNDREVEKRGDGERDEENRRETQRERDTEREREVDR